MNIKSYLLLILLLTNYLFGQTFILKGKVIDSKNGSAIQGAVVFISYNLMSSTNNDGTYSIDNISGESTR